MNRKILLLLLCLFSIGTVTESNAQFWKKKKQSAKVAKVKKESAYEKLLKTPQKVSKGLMNMYYIDKKLYLEIPLDLLGRDMLLASTISEISDNAYGVVGAKQYNPIRVEFTMVDSVIQLRKVVKNIITPEKDRNIARALEKNSIGAIVKLFKVKAFNKDRTKAVIDVTDYFLSDIKELSPFGGISLNAARRMTRTSMFKRDRSFIGDIKSFDDNITIKSHLSYENTLKRGKYLYEDKKPFTAVMTRTFLLLPEVPARPRLADMRVGIFTTGKIKLSNDKNKTEEVYYANRWRLEPKDVEAFEKGELVEPVKPIVFYVDSDFPASWKESVKAAINDWNIVFEKIGYKNAIKAIDYPENDPEFDPDNLKYNCVRYSPTPIANAMGPSWVDPRTGEIINASVYVYHDLVKLLNNWIFIQTSPADKEVRNVKLPEPYKQFGIRYVIRHEVGHCLGFMHNMSSSAVIPVDSLRSPSFTQKYGTTYSIMDYARFNYVAQPGDKEKGVKLTPPKFGLYDYFLVKWNYSYFPGTKTTEEDAEILSKMVSEKAGDEIYRYGKQQGMVIDPSSQMEDLGDDAVKASVYGIKNLKYIMKNMNTWVSGQDKDYSYRSSIWNGIITQYFRYMNHVYGNIGGIYINQKYEGDPRPWFVSVSKEKQRVALKFLLNEMLNLDWLEDRAVMENMELTGTPSGLLRNKVVEALMASCYKVNLSSLKSKEKYPYTPKACMKDIYTFVWNKTIKGRTLTKAEKELQKAFVKSMIMGTGLKPAGGLNGMAFVSDNSFAISLPDFVEEKNIKDFGYSGYQNYLNPCSADVDNNPVAGFGHMFIHYNVKASLETLYYKTMVNVKSLLKKRVNTTRDEETRFHYQVLLHQIEKTLK